MRRPILTVALLVTALGGGFALLSLRGRDITPETPVRVVQVGFAVAEQEKAAEAPKTTPPGTPDVLSIPPPISPNELAEPAAPSLPPTENAPVSPAPEDSTPSPLPPAKGSVPSPPASDDPLQAVDSFVERNRTEANTAIEKLSEEAKELKERLAKVESALARWKKISQAFDQHGAGNEAAAEPSLEAAPGQEIPSPVETVKEVGSEPPLDPAPR